MRKRLRHLLIALVAVLAVPALASEWETVGGKREIHYRIFQDESAMLDIACSVNLRVLLGATFQSNRAGFTRNFAIYIDDVPSPNYLNPETPPKHRADFYRFWNKLKNAKKLVIEANGYKYNISTDNLKEQLPETYDTTFMCRPITTDGLLIP